MHGSRHIWVLDLRRKYQSGTGQLHSLARSDSVHIHCITRYIRHGQDGHATVNVPVAGSRGLLSSSGTRLADGSLLTRVFVGLILELCDAVASRAGARILGV